MGAPNGVPSFLVYDEAKGATVASGTEYTTAGGGTALRTSGDIISYTAPATTGEDSFVLSFHDGFAPTLVTVTVTITE